MDKKHSIETGLASVTYDKGSDELWYYISKKIYKLSQAQKILFSRAWFKLACLHIIISSIPFL